MERSRSLRIALGLEYDGSGFHGWQRQDGGVQHTVQSCLEQALGKIADCEVRTVAAGRTDAGVHACLQVAHFDAPVERPLRAWTAGVNSLLPAAVRVLWAQPAAADFHARFSALARRYRYLILNAPQRPALLRRQLDWEPQPLDVEAMQKAAQALVGEHDFRAFCATGDQSKSTMRRVHFLRVFRRPPLVVIDVQANAFLWRMVRNFAGALKAVGCGREPVDWVRRTLAGRDRRCAGATASASGLYLVDVLYPEQHPLPKRAPGPFFLFPESAPDIDEHAANHA